MKKIFLTLCIIILAMQTKAQQKPDTVIVELAKTSKVVFTMKDRSDLQLLKQYDFQSLFNDIIVRLENKDSAKVVATTPTTEEITTQNEEVDWGEEDNDDDWNSVTRVRHRHRGSRHSFNFDIGTNNYLSNEKFPDADEPYAVRPWGSWYVGINSVQRSQLGNKFYIEWGLGLSWYNFKFEDASVVITEDPDGVVFTQNASPDVSFKKSKLTISYINASIVPVIDFGGYRSKARIWESRGGFRIGAGPYAGYRIGSHTKNVYKEDGDREKDKDRDNFHLNNLRYGVRLQIGIRSTDLFFNYDLNELFDTSKPNNPNLNAFSFGIIF